LLEPENENWHEIGDETPDGAFAIIRSNDQTVQLVTDTLGQRTLWYVLTENFFIASTSQRAILLYLGGFELNEAVIP
jgi:asparagine synthetase B (glutamine-hydrolysing)